MQHVGLHQQAVEINAIQQLAQSRDFAAGIGGVGVLSDRHAQAVGVVTHLGDKTRCAGGLSRRADSKSQQVADFGCRRAISSSVVMSCITACIPARID